MKVTRKVTTNGNLATRTIEVPFDFGNTLQDAVIAHGEATVYAMFVKGAQADIEAEASRLMASGPQGSHRLTDAEVLTKLSTYRLGTDGAKRDASLAAISRISDPLVRKAALDALGATEDELPKPKPKAAPKAKPAAKQDASATPTKPAAAAKRPA